jgi:hypothetical protein
LAPAVLTSILLRHGEYLRDAGTPGILLLAIEKPHNMRIRLNARDEDEHDGRRV